MPHVGWWAFCTGVMVAPVLIRRLCFPHLHVARHRAGLGRLSLLRRAGSLPLFLNFWASRLAGHGTSGLISLPFYCFSYFLVEAAGSFSAPGPTISTAKQPNFYVVEI